MLTLELDFEENIYQNAIIFPDGLFACLWDFLYHQAEFEFVIYPSSNRNNKTKF